MGKKTARAIYCLLLIIVLSAFLFFLSTRLNKSLMREIQALATGSKKTMHWMNSSTTGQSNSSTDSLFSQTSNPSKKGAQESVWGSYFSKPPATQNSRARNPYIPIPQRITLSHIEGDNEKNCFATNYSSLEILLGGEYVPGKFLPMIDLEGNQFDDETYAASIGLVTRMVPDKHSYFCRMLGFNVFYDFRQGNIGYYNLVSAGLEVLGKRWDFRANVYVPFGAKRRVKVCTFDDYIGSYYATEFTYEAVSYSFNAEVGWLAINSQYILLYFAGGPYYIAGRTCRDTTRGGEFRVQPQYKDYLAVNCIVSFDSLFKTVFQAEVILHLPLYLLSKKISKKETCGLTARQIYQPVSRFEVMPLSRCSCWNSNF